MRQQLHGRRLLLQRAHIHLEQHQPAARHRLPAAAAAAPAAAAAALQPAAAAAWHPHPAGTSPSASHPGEDIRSNGQHGKQPCTGDRASNCLPRCNTLQVFAALVFTVVAPDNFQWTPSSCQSISSIIQVRAFDCAHRPAAPMCTRLCVPTMRPSHGCMGCADMLPQIQITMYNITTSSPQCYLSGQALSVTLYFASATDSVLFRQAPSCAAWDGNSHLRQALQHLQGPRNSSSVAQSLTRTLR